MNVTAAGVLADSQRKRKNGHDPSAWRRAVSAPQRGPPDLEGDGRPHTTTKGGDMRKRKLYELARHGRVPAEELDTEQRAQLVTELHGQGWSDLHIADHTRQTEYTVARIRARLGLAAHHDTEGARH